VILVIALAVTVTCTGSTNKSVPSKGKKFLLVVPAVTLYRDRKSAAGSRAG